MSLIHSFHPPVPPSRAANCLPQTAAVPDQIESTSTIATAKIKLDDLSMIIVPVSINGSGSYDFLLDTGCAKTMIDQKLAEELGLPQVGREI